MIFKTEDHQKLSTKYHVRRAAERPELATLSIGKEHTKKLDVQNGGYFCPTERAQTNVLTFRILLLRLPCRRLDTRDLSNDHLTLFMLYATALFIQRFF